MFRSKRYHLFVYLQFTYRRKVLVSRLLPPIRSAMMHASKRHQWYYFLVRSYAWRQVASSSSDCPRYVRGTYLSRIEKVLLGVATVLHAHFLLLPARVKTLAFILAGLTVGEPTWLVSPTKLAVLRTRVHYFAGAVFACVIIRSSCLLAGPEVDFVHLIALALSPHFMLKMTFDTAYKTLSFSWFKNSNYDVSSSAPALVLCRALLFMSTTVQLVPEWRISKKNNITSLYFFVKVIFLEAPFSTFLGSCHFSLGHINGDSDIIRWLHLCPEGFVLLFKRFLTDPDTGTWAHWQFRGGDEHVGWSSGAVICYPMVNTALCDVLVTLRDRLMLCIPPYLRRDLSFDSYTIHTQLHPKKALVGNKKLARFAHRQLLIWSNKLWIDGVIPEPIF